MTDENVFVIRRFGYEDRRDVRRICCETAFMQDPSSIFFADDEIFADALTLYFTDYEPESCLVLEHGGRVAGYLIGTKNIKVANKIFMRNILFGLLRKALLRGALVKKKNIIFFFHVLKSIIKLEFRMPDFSKGYPATLHINIDKDYRAQGFGSQLVAAYLQYLKTEKVPGVHFATMSDKAMAFFAKQGFSLLFQGRRSYFKYILHKENPIYIFGMRL